MKSLWEGGIAHVRSGETSLDELLRVLEVPIEDAPKRTSGSVAQPRTSPGTGSAPPPAVHEPPRPAERVTIIPHLPAEALELRDELELDGTGTPGAGGEKLRVLLVEDEPQLRRLLREMLERDGFAVGEAEDGVKALDEVDRWAPDIVVLDLDLPRLDGYGVLTHLRARRATEHLPVLVLTAKGDEDSEVRVFEFGANDYLSKPLRSRVLSARLRSLLKKVRNGVIDT